jgi:threonine aldolase
VIDLRSDTTSQPTDAMRARMAAAAVGDDVFGDDPGVNALQEKVAQLAGKEAALLLPSGTQSNLVALLSHCQRGEEYIVGQDYHSYLYEAGGGAVFGSLQPQPIAVEADGSLNLDLVASRIKPDDPHFAVSK